MKKFVFLAAFALVASLILATAAVAQDEEEQLEDVVQEELTEAMVEQQTGEQFEEEPVAEQLVEEQVEEEVAEQMAGEAKAEQKVGELESPIEEKIEAQIGQPSPQDKGKMEGTQPLPKSGGLGLGSASMLLPAIALLLGTGVLAFTVLRRR